MSTWWLIPILLAVFVVWAGVVLERRGPHRPGEEDKWHKQQWGV